MKCKHNIETSTGICGLCHLEDDGNLHWALEQNTRPLLNPWIIEVAKLLDTSLTLNIVNSVTGEIRQTELSVDDISAIMYAGTERIHALAATVDDDDRSLLDNALRIHHREED